VPRLAASSKSVDLSDPNKRRIIFMDPIRKNQGSLLLSSFEAGKSFTRNAVFSPDEAAYFAREVEECGSAFGALVPAIERRPANPGPVPGFRRATVRGPTLWSPEGEKAKALVFSLLVMVHASSKPGNW
jgi:hypothetical protein